MVQVRCPMPEQTPQSNVSPNQQKLGRSLELSNSNKTAPASNILGGAINGGFLSAQPQCPNSRHNLELAVAGIKRQIVAPKNDTPLVARTLALARMGTSTRNGWKSRPHGPPWCLSAPRILTKTLEVSRQTVLESPRTKALKIRLKSLICFWTAPGGPTLTTLHSRFLLMYAYLSITNDSYLFTSYIYSPEYAVCESPLMNKSVAKFIF